MASTMPARVRSPTASRCRTTTAVRSRPRSPRPTQSIDIVIYEFGGPNLVGQTSDPGWLIDAVERGVDVRLILNGEVFDDACTGVDASSQADCAWNYELDPYYATLAQLRAARRRALAAGGPAGRVSIQFANNDFNITHQKTILIDAVDANGDPLRASRAGRLADRRGDRDDRQPAGLPLALGSAKRLRRRREDADQPRLPRPTRPPVARPRRGAELELRGRVGGARLRRDPRRAATTPTTCGASSPSSPLTSPAEGPSPRTDTNGLLGTKLADTWANGSTYAFDAGAAYPDWTEGGYYPLDGVQPDLPEEATVQGNSRRRQLRLISRARESLRVYNEEMSDYNYDEPTDPTTIVGALARAGDRLGKGKVRVVMAGTVSPSNSYAEEFDTLAAPRRRRSTCSTTPTRPSPTSTRRRSSPTTPTPSSAPRTSRPPRWTTTASSG